MPAKYLGRCWACEYYPVAFDAPTCPRCGVKNPNPGLGNRYGKFGALVGFLLGPLIGGILMAITTDQDRLNGFLAGSLFGMLLGLIAGFILGRIVGGILAFTQEIEDPRNEDDRHRE